MSGLSSYEKSCDTIDKDKSGLPWTNTLKRLVNEWKKIESDKDSLQKEGIYIQKTDDFSVFNIMIFKKDNAGPYKYTPFCFTIKPCRDETGQAYPLIPPIVRFVSFTSTYIHPNIKPCGSICISALTYSYIGSGVAVWNPMMNIRSIANILSGLLDEAALLQEPGYSTLSKKDQKVLDFDEGVKYHCMSYLTKLFTEKDMAIKLFGDIIEPYKTEILEYVKNECKDKPTKTVSTYAFNTTLDYRKLIL
jgi:ubiquitin-protein ligase